MLDAIPDLRETLTTASQRLRLVEKQTPACPSRRLCLVRSGVSLSLTVVPDLLQQR
jgi:hypothetical protein